MIRGGAIFGTALALAGALVLSFTGCAHAQVIGGGGGGSGSGACASNPCPIANGGTGATSAASARTGLGITPANIGAAASGANSDITSLSGITTPLTVAQGGSGSGSHIAHGLRVGEGTSPDTGVCVLTAGQLEIGQGATSDPACVSVSGDSTITAGGVMTNSGLNGSPLATYFASPPAFGLTTPARGVFTGQTGAGNVCAGCIGEVIQSSFSSVTITSAIMNVSSISLTAGDWDVSQETDVTDGSGLLACQIGISQTSVTFGGGGSYDLISTVTAAGLTAWGAKTINTRVNVTSPTTVYLVGDCTITAGVASATGIIRARRVD